ncbi:shikimate dehydrogenase [Buchnera aphidicola]|uniref:shikimate dehydrogenase n=1 Tax=Buchnera aphidicola TaxID=9 RepID=UPI0034639706
MENLLGMISKKKYNYLLFGESVLYSKSPVIYSLFSYQTDFIVDYGICNVTKDNFFSKMCNFFYTDGKGANVTVPFKELVCQSPVILTNRAKLCNSVNFLKKNKKNEIIGDNTDGMGLVYDLKRLNCIYPNYNILLIGSGGAARGIIPNLLNLNCTIDIVNRNFINAKKLELFFNHLGPIKAIDIVHLKKINYHLVINATARNVEGKDDFFISNVVFYPSKTFFYDLNYGDNITPFLSWCIDNGAIYYSDGIGMLVSQAAYSFYYWSNIFPEINPVINILNESKKYFI